MTTLGIRASLVALLAMAACAEVPPDGVGTPAPLVTEATRAVAAAPAPQAPAPIVAPVTVAVAGRSGPAAFPLPAPLATTQTTMPSDAVRVAAAVVDRLRGGSGMAAGVLFSDAAGAAVGAAHADVPGFDWHDTRLLQYTGQPGPDRTAAATLEFVDEFNRRAAILFSATYGVADEPIEVKDITIAPLYSLSPRVLLYAIAARDLPQAAAPKTPGALLQIAAAFGMPWREEALAEGDYVLAVFVMDRISPSAKFTVAVGERNGPEGFSDTARYLEQNNFRAAVIPAHLSAATAKTWVKAIVTPGVEVDAGDRAPFVAGLFPLDPRTQTAGE